MFPIVIGAGRRPVVAIVAPSGYAADPLELQRAVAQLQAQGCEVRRYDDPAARYLRFAAPDAARVAGLHAAASDPEIDIIIALRGGYGVSRLLPEIDFALLADSGKRIVGHSDFTALQMGLLCHGAVSFAGPMLCADFSREQVSRFTMHDFWCCLNGPAHTVTLAGDGNPVVDAEGVLWGGNLAMLTHLVGTPWMPTIDGGILFLEDINEHSFRVERMLLQLLHAGVLARQAAIVLGDFSGGATGDYDNGYDFAAMLAFVRSRTTVPIVTGLPFGHIHDKVTLAVGSRARLCGDGSALVLTMQDYPVLGDSRT
ncbi:MAG: muramoyltetrapeptide carboxypeptidase [Herminiimonas sp.]|nr:muramoyltetrapeptide carboxypeptidase [Herminiimonas sp.]